MKPGNLKSTFPIVLNARWTHTDPAWPVIIRNNSLTYEKHMHTCEFEFEESATVQPLSKGTNLGLVAIRFMNFVHARKNVINCVLRQ